MNILAGQRAVSKDDQTGHFKRAFNTLHEQGHEVTARRAGHAHKSAGLGDDVSWVRKLRQCLPKAVYGLLGSGCSEIARARLKKATDGNFAKVPTHHEAKGRLGCFRALVPGFAGSVRDWHAVDRASSWMASGNAPADASPPKLFEYLPLGKAIKAPSMPNIPEVLRHDHNALLFDDSSPTAFAQALARLAAAPQLAPQC